MDPVLAQENTRMHFRLRCRADSNVNSCVGNNGQNYDAALEVQAAVISEHLNKGSLRVSNPLFLRASNAVVFEVIVDNGKEVVSAILKVGNPSAVLQTEFGTHSQQFAKVTWCTSQIGQFTSLPVAKTIASGVIAIRNTEVPWSIESKLDGKEIPDFAGPQEAAKLWNLAGRISSEILRVSPVGYGGRFDPMSNQFVGTWESFVDEQVASAKLDSLERLGVLSNEERHQTEAIFGSAVSTLDRRYPRALSHRDLSPQNNILFSRNILDDQLAVSGVIDFEQAASVPGPVFEIAMVRFYQVAWNRNVDFPSYLKGLGIEASDYYGTQLERDCDATLLLRLCPEAQWLSANKEHDYIRLYRLDDMKRLLKSIPELIRKLAD